MENVGNLEFESGCVANLTASRVSTERVRKLRFFQPRQYVSVDYSRRDVFAQLDPPLRLMGWRPQRTPLRRHVSNQRSVLDGSR